MGSVSGEREDEMRGDVEQPLPLLEGFVDEWNLAVLEIPQPTVDQAARPARGAGGDVGLVEQEDLEATQCGVAGDAGALQISTAKSWKIE